MQQVAMRRSFISSAPSPGGPVSFSEHKSTRTSICWLVAATNCNEFLSFQSRSFSWFPAFTRMTNASNYLILSPRIVSFFSRDELPLLVKDGLSLLVCRMESFLRMEYNFFEFNLLFFIAAEYWMR